MPTSDDPARGLAWLRGTFTGALFHFCIWFPPAPKPAPRLSRFGGVYYPKTFSEFYAEAQRQLTAQRDSHPHLETPRVAVVEAVVAKPKTTVRSVPGGDVDNYCKGILDAAKHAGLFKDDDSFTHVATMKRWTEPGEKPHANLWIGEKA